MIETVCAKFRKQNHPNNTLLLTWAAFLSQKHLIYLDLYIDILIHIGYGCGLVLVQVMQNEVFL